MRPRARAFVSDAFLICVVVRSLWLKSARELRDFIKRSGMYVARALFKTIGGIVKGFRCFMNGVSLFNYFKSHFCVTLSHMVPSSRGKRWTIPDNSEDASAGDKPHAARTIFSNSEHQQNKTQCLIHHNAMFVRVPYLRVLLHEAFCSARRHILWQSCDF